MATRGTAGEADLIAPQPVGDRVFEILQQEILSLVLPPGTHLNEAFLAQRFGISVTPIREALHRLTHTGYAVRQAVRGVKVRELSVREVRDIYELRHILEPIALAQSIPYLTHAMLRQIEKTLLQAKEAMDENDMTKAAMQNSEFHSLLIAAAPNRMMISWLESLRNLQRLITLREWFAEDRSRIEYDEHCAILNRVNARDIEGASALLTRHIGRFIDANTA